MPASPGLWQRRARSPVRTHLEELCIVVTTHPSFQRWLGVKESVIAQEWSFSMIQSSQRLQNNNKKDDHKKVISTIIPQFFVVLKCGGLKTEEKSASSECEEEVNKLQPASQPASSLSAPGFPSPHSDSELQRSLPERTANFYPARMFVWQRARVLMRSTHCLINSSLPPPISRRSRPSIPPRSGAQLYKKMVKVVIKAFFPPNLSHFLKPNHLLKQFPFQVIL